MNTALIRKVLWVIIFALIVSVVWLSFQAYQATVSSQTTQVSGPLIKNMYYPTVTKDGEIRYYNGDTFVTLNPANNTPAQLTSIRGLTDLTSVYWTKEGVVFTVGAAAEWHPVYKAFTNYVNQRDGDSDPDSFSDDSVLNNFHWYLSFKTNALSLMSVGVDDAILFATPTTEGGLLFREFPNYSLLQPDGSVKRGVALLPDPEKERRVIRASQSEYVYVAEKNGDIGIFKHDIVTNKDSDMITKLYSNKQHSIYSEVFMAGDDVFYLTAAGQEGTSAIYKYNIASKATTKLVDSFQGFINKSLSGEITAVHNGGELTKFYNLQDMAKTQTIRKPLAIPKFYLSGSNNYFVTSIGHVYKVGGQSVNAKPDVALEKKIFGDNDFALTRNIESNNDNSYTVTYITGTTKDRMNQVYNAVSDAGYNPLEFSFIPNPGPRVIN